MSLWSGYRDVLPYLRPHRAGLALITLVSLVATASGLAQPYLTKYLIDEALLRRDRSALAMAAALMVVFTAVAFVLNIVSSWFYTRLSAQVLFAMRLTLYRHLLSLSPRFWARARLGDVVSRLNNDVAEVQRVTADAILSLLSNLVFLAGSVAIMVSLDARLFVLSVALLPPAVWSLTRFQRRLASRVEVMRERSASIGSFLIETLMGVRVVVAHQQQDCESAAFARRNDSFVEALLGMQMTSYLASALPGAVLTLSTAIVFFYGGSLVIGGALSMGGLVAFLAYHMRLLAPVQNLMSLYTNLVTGAVSLGRLRDIWRVQPEVTDNAAACPLGPVRGDVEFRNIYFRHDDTPVLAGVSFAIPAGSVGALIGPSGGGKSTIADLLVRFQDPDHGEILIDGKNLRDMRLADLRKAVGLVEQTPFLFHATVLENLRYGKPDASREEVIAAAGEAALDGFVASLPEGYDTVVGERGLTLSAGQRQRIALARVLLRRPAVVILDEPTAALDPETETAIRDTIHRGGTLRGCTVILITHRESLAAIADQVLVLREGQVKVRAQHQALLPRS